MFDVLKIYCYENSAKSSIADVDALQNSYVFIHFLEKYSITVGSVKVDIQPHSILIYDRSKDIVFPETELAFNAIYVTEDIKQLLEEAGLKVNKVYSLKDPDFLARRINDLKTEYNNSRQHRKRLLSLKIEEIILSVSREIINEALNGKNSKSILKGFDFEEVWQTTETYPTLKIFNKERERSPVWSGKSGKHNENHSGTEDDPYLIESAEELAYIILNDHGIRHYRLTRDIYLNDIDKINWSTGELLDPDYKINYWFLGRDLPSFNGVIDGDGHVVYGIYYNTVADYDEEIRIGAALIPIMGRTTVKNIGVECSYFRQYDNFSVAAIVGIAHYCGRGRITNCYVGSSVTIIGHDAGSIAGGGDLGPDRTVVIENCYSLARLSGDRFIGAFVGNVWVEDQWFIKNCYCLGKPYGSVWKMPTLENSYSTEPGIGNLSILIANDIPDDFSQETVMRFRQLRGKMFNSLNEKWTISRMAKETNFGESHFQHLYKKMYGVSPTADLISERMIKAKHLLTYEAISITKIASMLGYENSTHFTRQFKKEIGLSPAGYRSNTRHRDQ